MLEVIRSSAKKIPKGLIDIPLFDKEIIEGLKQIGVDASEGFYDLRLDKINSLERSHTFSNCKTWKEAVDKLKCKNWDEKKIIKWFSTPIYDTLFPAEGSRSELRIGIVGGARFCKLGNHRLVAAKVWMLANKPNAPILKKVHHYYYPVEPTALPILSKGLKPSIEVSFDPGSRGQKYLYVKYEKKWELYQLRNGYELIKSGKYSFMSWFYKRKHTLKLVPPELIKELRADTWPDLKT